MYSERIQGCLFCKRITKISHPSLPGWIFQPEVSYLQDLTNGYIGNTLYNQIHAGYRLLPIFIINNKLTAMISIFLFDNVIEYLTVKTGHETLVNE